MHFTLVFPEYGIGPSSRTYHLVYHPVPIWTRYADSSYGAEEVCNPYGSVDYSGERYQIGYLKPLIEKEGLTPDPNPNVVLCVHQNGHGTEDDIKTLSKDLDSHGFNTILCRLDSH